MSSDSELSSVGENSRFPKKEKMVKLDVAEKKKTISLHYGTAVISFKFAVLFFLPFENPEDIFI